MNKELEATGSQELDERIRSLGDWRGEALAKVRSLMKEAVPDVVEEMMWKKPSNAMSGTPTWYSNGIICTGETYKTTVKMTFAKGAALPDPAKLFNSSLEGNVRRAIDIKEGEKIDEKELKVLFRAAADLNAASANKPGKKA
ncbi:MAG TPA: DUF1801 domain-containing protein [Fimbriimonadaceae bacterium]|jgi:hypothetical protein